MGGYMEQTTVSTVSVFKIKCTADPFPMEPIECLGLDAADLQVKQK